MRTVGLVETLVLRDSVASMVYVLVPIVPLYARVVAWIRNEMPNIVELVARFASQVKRVPKVPVWIVVATPNSSSAAVVA